MDSELYHEIAAQYGTPVYVLEQKELDRSIEEIAEALSTLSMKAQMAYPYKANSLRRLCQHIHKKGLWAEVASSMELEMALAVGAKPAHVVFNGPYKSTRDLRAAIAAGCLINIDNIEECRRILQIAQATPIDRIPIGIRVSHSSVSHWDRFGFSLDEEAYAATKYIAAEPLLYLAGVHAHRSNIQSLRDYEEHVAAVLRFADRIMDEGLAQLEYINLGSGFAVDYPRPRDVPTWKAPTMEQYATVILNAWKETCLSESLVLMIEPGRRLVASSATLLTRVVSVKSRSGKRLAIVDAGSNLVPGVDLYNYRISQCERTMEPLNTEEYILCGCLCDSLDVLARDAQLCSPREGDLLAIRDVGGYDMSRSFSWQIPRPPVVWVGQYKETELVRRAETMEYVWELAT